MRLFFGFFSEFDIVGKPVFCDCSQSDDPGAVKPNDGDSMDTVSVASGGRRPACILADDWSARKVCRPRT